MYQQQPGSKHLTAVHTEPVPDLPQGGVYPQPFEAPASAQLRQSERFFDSPNAAHHDTNRQVSPQYPSPNASSPARHDYLSPVSAAAHSNTATSPAYQISREQHYHDQQSYSLEKPHQLPREKRTPAMVFGMKWRTFILVAIFIILVVVGAAVGGAVGGKNLQKSASGNTSHSDSTNAAAAVAASDAISAPFSTTGLRVTNTAAAPTPSFTPLDDCAAANNTLFISDYSSGSSGTVKPATMGLQFVKACDAANPLAAVKGGSRTISEAYVYSFSDCIEVCAGFNFWNNVATCNVAVYQRRGGRPGNCWVGSTGAGALQGDAEGQFGGQLGTDVAVLQFTDEQASAAKSAAASAKTAHPSS